MKKQHKLKDFIAFLVIIGCLAGACKSDDDENNNEHKSPVINVTGVTLDKSTLTMTVGDTETLIATVAPQNATNKVVSWTSSDDNVATVSGGTVSAVKAGSATITVTTADGGKTATCAVTVSKMQESFTISFIADAAPVITGPTIHLNSANGPTTATLTVANSDQYSLINWIDMNGMHRQGASFTVSAADYDSAGNYVLTLEVLKDGIPYNRTIIIKVEA